MRLALVFLVACWTGPVHVDPVVRPHVRAVRYKPQCWSIEFYEEWPQEAALYDIIEKCGQMWPDQEVADSCVYMEMWHAYQALWYWTQRWFDSCDPKRS